MVTASLIVRPDAPALHQLGSHMSRYAHRNTPVRVRRIELQRRRAWNRGNRPLIVKFPAPLNNPPVAGDRIVGSGRNDPSDSISDGYFCNLNRLFRSGRIVVVSICKRSHERARYSASSKKPQP